MVRNVALFVALCYSMHFHVLLRCEVECVNCGWPLDSSGQCTKGRMCVKFVVLISMTMVIATVAGPFLRSPTPPTRRISAHHMKAVNSP